MHPDRERRDVHDVGTAHLFRRHHPFPETSRRDDRRVRLHVVQKDEEGAPEISSRQPVEHDRFTQRSHRREGPLGDAGLAQARSEAGIAEGWRDFLLQDRGGAGLEVPVPGNEDRVETLPKAAFPRDVRVLRVEAGLPAVALEDLGKGLELFAELRLDVACAVLVRHEVGEHRGVGRHRRAGDRTAVVEDPGLARPSRQEGGGRPGMAMEAETVGADRVPDDPEDVGALGRRSLLAARRSGDDRRRHEDEGEDEAASEDEAGAGPITPARDRQERGVLPGRSLGRSAEGGGAAPGACGHLFLSVPVSTMRVGP